MSAFIEIFSTTDGRSQSMQSGSKPRTILRSTFGEFSDDDWACLPSNDRRKSGVVRGQERVERIRRARNEGETTGHLRESHRC